MRSKYVNIQFVGAKYLQKQDSRDVVASGLEEAQALHDLLEILVRAVQKHTTDIATSQEITLRTSTEKWNDEVGVLVTALTAVVATSLDQMVSLSTIVGSS